jgi:hypothetical protein
VNNRIIGDNYLTNPSLDRRNVDADATDQSATARRDPAVTPDADRADLHRAQQRLKHESGEVTQPTIDAHQAHARLEQLKGLLQEDPRSALQAHQNVNGDLFEAAMARPTI